jgi:hypothetical protein
LTSLQVGAATASVTFAGEAIGIIGADVSIPRAFWLKQGLWCWPSCIAPQGAFAVFNTIGSPPIGFANALIIGDPPSLPPLEIQDLITGLGGPSNLPVLGSLSIDAMGNVTPPALSGSFVMSPEPPYFFALGAGCLLAALYRRRRQRRNAASA